MNLDHTTEYAECLERMQSLIRGQASEVNWADLESALEYDVQQIRSHPRRTTVALLPALTCAAAGGEIEPAIPIAAAWTCYRLAAHLLDDVVDADASDLAPWRPWHADQAVNVGVGLIALAQRCLSQMKTGALAQSEIHQAISQAFLFSARGQARPSQKPNLDEYFQYIITKSSAPFAGFAWAGARLHTRRKQLLDRLFNFGLALGAFIQILDDVENFVARGMSDLSAGVYTLPIIFALHSVQHPEYPRLIDLLAQPRWSDDNRQVLQEILDQMDVVTQVAQMAQRYAGQAREALQGLPKSLIAPLCRLRQLE